MSEVSITGFMFGFIGKVRITVHSSIVNGGIPSKASSSRPLIRDYYV